MTQYAIAPELLAIASLTTFLVLLPSKALRLKLMKAIAFTKKVKPIVVVTNERSP
jgi:hypothetical protein